MVPGNLRGKLTDPSDSNLIPGGLYGRRVGYAEPDPAEIARRARTIRRRRGLSLDTAAGLAGISKPYLSMLERGQRRFQRRGLLEDLAQALGCAVADLTASRCCRRIGRLPTPRRRYQLFRWRCTSAPWTTCRTRTPGP